ncbi:hypothetical protein ANANG_G00098480 [Anguilla anguilla]|uniref:Uncharacterized protein n=1 Tax=Anguilla anguilla TaxID=7936 RepID=A0A9D3MJH9_ANGAN|nr:hypothetical protein ANANG_G00098480 [Anguilla anguilla]
MRPRLLLMLRVSNMAHLQALRRKSDRLCDWMKDTGDYIFLRLNWCELDTLSPPMLSVKLYLQSSRDKLV